MGDINSLYEAYTANNRIDPKYYEKFNVKRGLRNPDGSGVMAGVTNICNVHGYVINEGEKSPDEGKLVFRGYNINDLVSNVVAENRFGYEEIAYLLLGGKLPTEHQLENFRELLDNNRELPEGFFDDMILKAPSKNIMNKMSRAVLALYSYDDVPDNTEVKHEVDTAVSIIAKMPVIMVSAYHVKQRDYNHKSMFMHPLIPGQSTAETILSMLRPDRQFTDEEAKLLDVMLMLHAEHGGGNNSTFTTHVVTSSGTDTYSAVAAALGSLKGPKHGGANVKVTAMFEDLNANISDWTDEEEVACYLTRLLRKDAFDKSGLIYGMGHAVYSISDPRANIFRGFVDKLAAEKGMEKELGLYHMVEQLAPKVISHERHIYKGVSANVDFYSGFVYSMLDLPTQLFTPIFAIARVVGWSAHRLEELANSGKIIRPAYKGISEIKDYVPIEKR